MKTKLMMLAAASLVSTAVFAVSPATTHGKFDRNHFRPAQMADTNEKVDINDVSYSFGFTMGGNLTRQKMDINIDQFIAGLKDSLAGKDGKFKREEMMKMLMSYQRQMMQKRAEQQKVEAAKNKAAGEKFLAQNKTKPGVVTLASGLQYKIIKAGNGVKPAKTDKVKVNYTGKLINGDVFSSSENAKEPVAFSLAQVIPAWREALPLMTAGSTWELYVPADLAYGARGTRGEIGPNAALIFKIHLVSVEKQKQVDNKDKASLFQKRSKKREL